MSMKTKTILAALGLLWVGTSGLLAQQVEIAPFYGYRFGGEVQNPLTGRTYAFQDSDAYGLVLDLPLKNSPGKLELLWSRQDSSVDLQGLAGVGRVDVTIDQIQIGGIMETGDQRFCEYVAVLVGATVYDTEDYGSDTRFSMGLGVGGKYFLTPKLALRADVRGFCTIVDASGAFISSGGSTVVAYNGTGVWQGEATLGLSLSF